MKISIKGENPLTLGIPTGLVLNSLTASMLSRKLREYGLQITPAQARRLIQAVKKYRKAHPEWTLVDIISAKGENIQIRL